MMFFYFYTNNHENSKIKISQSASEFHPSGVSTSYFRFTHSTSGIHPQLPVFTFHFRCSLSVSGFHSLFRVSLPVAGFHFPPAVFFFHFWFFFPFPVFTSCRRLSPSTINLHSLFLVFTPCCRFSLSTFAFLCPPPVVHFPLPGSNLSFHFWFTLFTSVFSCTYLFSLPTSRFHFPLPVFTL